MSKEKEMTYEEKQEKLEERLEGTDIDSTFHNLAETVTLQTTGRLHSNIFTEIEAEFKSSQPTMLKEDGRKVTGIELEFQL